MCYTFEQLLLSFAPKLTLWFGVCSLVITHNDSWWQTMGTSRTEDRAERERERESAVGVAQSVSWVCSWAAAQTRGLLRLWKRRPRAHSLQLPSRQSATNAGYNTHTHTANYCGDKGSALYSTFSETGGKLTTPAMRGRTQRSRANERASLVLFSNPIWDHCTVESGKTASIMHHTDRCTGNVIGKYRSGWAFFWSS